MPDPLGRLAAGLGAATPGEALARLRRHPAVDGRAAAVLALFTDDPDPLIVLAERAATMRSHAGQVAFPGGAAEAGDAGPVATALRESREEVALRPETVEVIGELPAVHVAVSGFDVTTIVGRWAAPHPLRAADPAEVASVHRVPVSVLTDRATRCTAVHPRGFRGPAFVFDSDGQELFVWGLTAAILDGLLALGGWARPWEVARELPVPGARG